MSKPSFGLNIVNHAVIRKVGAKHRLLGICRNRGNNKETGRVDMRVSDLVKTAQQVHQSRALLVATPPVVLIDRNLPGRRIKAVGGAGHYSRIGNDPPGALNVKGKGTDSSFARGMGTDAAEMENLHIGGITRDTQ
ncbi:hypothetical protein, partial [Neorhizobium sp. DT-125]|uniref:hypothetical protein n=1 Tax=Neorhizobium sp. DT-125 TaxID=3396163 RepID=UPI003F1AE703